MKIKENEIKNSNIHALVYINPYTVIPVVMLFSTSHTIEIFKFVSKYF